MLNKYSRIVTKDDSQPAAQAMLHAIGLSEEDFDKPFIGVASTGYEGNPCNMHLNDLSVKIRESIVNSNYVRSPKFLLGVNPVALSSPKYSPCFVPTFE